MVALSYSRRGFVSARLLAATEMYFAHWEGHDSFDLISAFRSYLDAAFAAPDRRGFDLASLQFAAGLGNGHSAFDDDWLWQNHGASIGLRVIRLAEGWCVTESAHEGIAPGDIIERIDDIPIDTFFAGEARFISGSSYRERARRLFARPYLFPSKFLLQLGSGKRVAILRGSATLNCSLEPSARWIAPDKTLLLRIPGFSPPACEAEVVEMVRALRSDVRLIIDVRGNSGGNTPDTLVSALMPQPYRYWRSSTPVHNALEKAKGLPSASRRSEAEWMQPGPQAFSGALAILIDGGTFSAAEDFVVPFRDNGRALLIGEHTGGSSGQPYFEDLDDGMRLWISAKCQYLPSGEQFEGRGIAPDVVTELSAEDLRSRRDVALERAIEWADGS